MTRTTRYAMLSFLAVLFLFSQIAILSSCGTTETVATEGVSPAGEHAVHSEQLRKIMADLSELDNERLPQEMDKDAFRQRRLEDMQEAAKAMAATADRIPDVLEGVALSEEHKKEFVELTQAFKARSQELEEAATGLSAAGLEEKLSAIRESCDACHTKFRVLPAVSG